MAAFEYISFKPLRALAHLVGFCVSTVNQSHLLAVCEAWITQNRTWAANPTEQNSGTAAQITFAASEVTLHYMFQLRIVTLLPIVTFRLSLDPQGPPALLVRQVCQNIRAYITLSPGITHLFHQTFNLLSICVEQGLPEHLDTQVPRGKM